METQLLQINIDRIHRIEGDSPLKAFVDIVINESLLIKGIRLVDGKNGLFVSMPSQKAKDDKWYENVRALTKEVRDQISQEIISAYMSEHVVN